MYPKVFTDEILWYLECSFKNISGAKKQDEQNGDNYWNWDVRTWKFIYLCFYLLFWCMLKISTKKEKSHFISSKENDEISPGT